jgi:hypothetical protein
MYNPHVQVTVSLRRHSSLPSSFAAHSSRRIGRPILPTKMPLQHNPYVGWFRHAPPITTHDASQCHRFKSSPYVGWFRHAPSGTSHFRNIEGAQCHHHFRSSPYVGWFRHAPPTSSLSSSPLVPLYCPVMYYSHHPIQQYLSGRWREQPVLPTWSTWPSMSILKVLLLQLTSLFFSRTSPVSSHYMDMYSSDPIDSTASSSSKPTLKKSLVCCSHCDKHDTTPDTNPKPSFPLHHTPHTPWAAEMSLSSEAEAYYAHLAHKEEEEQQRPPRVVITQMDLLQRRHLDDASIRQLPIVTYLQDGDTDAWMGRTDPAASSHTILSSVHGDFLPLPIASTTCSSKSEVCVICLDHFQPGDSLRVLPCGHAFHVHCIDKWLSGSHSFDTCYTTACPTCKCDASVAALAASTTTEDVPSWAFAQVGRAL